MARLLRPRESARGANFSRYQLRLPAGGAFLRRNPGPNGFALGFLLRYSIIVGVDGAVTEYVLAQVENQAIGLGLVDAKPSPANLCEQSRRGGGAQDCDAVDAFGVEARGEYVHVDEPSQLAGLKSSEGFGSLDRHRAACDQADLFARCGGQHVRDMLGVLHS